MNETQPLEIEYEIARIIDIAVTRETLADFYRKDSDERLRTAHMHALEAARLRKYANNLRVRAARGETVLMGEA